MALTPQKISARTSLSGTGLVSRPAVRAGSTNEYRTVDNFEATTNPGVGDDDADGFHVGSFWLNKSSGVMFRCRDASTGAAQWMALGSPSHPGYQATFWYLPQGARTATGSAPGANSIKAFPFMVATRVTVSDLGARVTTLQASQAFQLAIYANDPATNRPTGAVLGSTGDISTGATGTVTGALGANVTLEPGRLYWFAFNVNHATPVFNSVSVTSSMLPEWVGSGTAGDLVLNSTSTAYAIQANQTYGTWPDAATLTWSLGPGGASHPLIMFKVASVP